MHDIELFWDVGSPYTYLAITQLPKMRERTGAKVRLRPFLLGGVFKSVGNKMVDVAPKAANLMEDLRRWARHYRVPMLIPGTDPVPFPINSLLPMRVATAALLADETEAERLIRELFNALWVEGKNVGEQAVLEDVLGDRAMVLMAEAQTPQVKDLLRKNTEEAVARGAFGAPTFFVKDQLFWGNDRLQFVEEAALLP